MRGVMKFSNARDIGYQAGNGIDPLLTRNPHRARSV
jgi:hypothetical protein